MIVENNKIVEATKQELFEKWLELEMDDIYSFDEYISKLEDIGVRIIDSQ